MERVNSLICITMCVYIPLNVFFYLGDCGEAG